MEKVQLISMTSYNDPHRHVVVALPSGNECELLAHEGVWDKLYDHMTGWFYIRVIGRTIVEVC